MATVSGSMDSASCRRRTSPRAVRACSSPWQDSATATLLDESFAVSRIGADARVSYRLGSSGAWLGREVARDNKSTPGSPVPHYSVGGWRQWKNVIVTLSLSSFGSQEGARAATMRREVRPTSAGPLAPVDSQRNFQSFDTITRHRQR